MSDDPLKKSVSIVIVSIGILVVAVAGVLLTNMYTKVTDAVEFENVSVFDPSRYPAPAAGNPGKTKYTQNCDNIIYRTTKGGVRYVRQEGGSLVIGAEYKNTFGFYKVEYGILKPVESASVDRYEKAKLEYALYNCDGPYSPSGTDF